MHQSALDHMQMCIDVYLRKDRHYKIVDFGSCKSTPRHRTHRELLTDVDHEYVGIDVRAGENVDVVMTKPYRIPLKSNSVDVVLSGQVFEHIPFPWASFLEISRILRPGGFAFITAPSRGEPHTRTDCWRYYPDSMRALAAFARMELREAHTDLPPAKSNKRFDYAAIDSAKAYWGDTVGVFRKPANPSRLVLVVGIVVRWWANRVGGVDHVPMPTPRPRRKAIAR